MDTFSMRCFLCVAEKLNLSKAADTMGISQPAMSAQIKKMELELGMPLLLRDTHTVALTAAGQIVQVRFQKILADCVELMDELEALKRRRKQLRVGWAGPTNWAGIQDVFYRLMEKDPTICTPNVNASYEKLLRGLENDEIDVAFFEQEMVRGRKNLKVLPLFRDAICFGMAMDHPLAGRGKVTPEELRGRTIYYKDRDYAEIQDIEAILLRAGVKAEAIVNVDKLDISVITAMVRGGLVVFPRSFKLHDNNTVAYVDFDLPEAPICYCAAWRMDNDNPILPRFIKCCREFAWPGERVE